MHNSRSKVKFLLCLLVVFVARGYGWTLWRSSNSNSNKELAIKPSNRGAVFELEEQATAAQAEDEALSKTLFLKSGHDLSVSYGDGNHECWDKAYSKLLSTCSDILKHEEKKSRLALEFTRCFLDLSGYPPLFPCPEHYPVRSCTAKLDQHNHKIYLGYFLEAASTCHYLQSAAFRKETIDAVNNLKQTGQEMVDKMKEVKDVSDEIVDDAVKRSQALDERLSGVESTTQSILDQSQQMDTTMKTTLGTAQAVHERYDDILAQQKELQRGQQEMEQAMRVSMKELNQAALRVQQQMDDIAQGNMKLGEQQVQLFDAITDNLQLVKESTIRSINELEEYQTSVREDSKYYQCFFPYAT